jgi:GNAT superfamily N-acetyltransferase
MLPRKAPPITASAWGQAMRDVELAQPRTGTVLGAFVEESTIGVGTGAADIQAIRAQTAGGRKLVKEDMAQYEGVSWYDGITDEAAQIQKEFNDKAQARAKIISEASTGQAIAGFVAGFGAGIIEPKNAAIGLGVTLAAGPLGMAGYLGNRARMAYQLAKQSTRARVAIGAGEGLVAAALIEPSNRYSAKVLQQDYTMMDSAFNVLTSSAFGAALPALPAASRLIKAKIEKFKGRTMDVVAAEVDLATQQLELGQRVDVSAVEAAQIGKLADAPVAKQVEAVKLTNSPEIAARFENKLVFDSNNSPIESANALGDYIQQKYGVEIYLAERKKDLYLASIKTPEDMRGQGLAKQAMADIIKYADSVGKRVALTPSSDFGANLTRLKGFYKEFGFVENKGKNKDYEISETFYREPVEGADGFAQYKDAINEASKQIDEANATTIAKHNAQAIDPKNDAIIDYDAIDALDERRAIMEVEAKAEAEMYFQQAEAEIRQMLDEGTLNDADLAEYRKILEDMNESKKTTDALETLKLCLTGL